MLLQQFNDSSIVQRIMLRHLLQGDTTDIVIEMYGTPAIVDHEALKTKTKETWKYLKGNERRKDQFNFQVRFENGRVIGWEDKN